MDSEVIRDLAEAGDFETLYKMWLDATPCGDQRTARHAELPVLAKLRLIEWGAAKAADVARAQGRLARHGGSGPSLDSFGVPVRWVSDVRRNIPASVTFEQMVNACDEGTVDGRLSRRALRAKFTGNDESVAKDRPEPLRGTHRMKPDRVIQSTVETLRGLCDGIEMLDQGDYDSLDPTLVPNWAAEIYECRRIVGKLHKELNARA